MVHTAERSRFGERAERSKIATVTARRPNPGHTLAVAAAGTLLVLVAFTTPLTTLASTAAGLGAGPGAQAWVLSAMNVGTAAGLLSSGAIGDDYGRRRTFLAGTLLLAGSSVLGAFAPTALVLVLARILQPLGGAAMLACGLGLIGHAFPEGSGRVRATGVWGAAPGRCGRHAAHRAGTRGPDGRTGRGPSGVEPAAGDRACGPGVGACCRVRGRGAPDYAPHARPSLVRPTGLPGGHGGRVGLRARGARLDVVGADGPRAGPERGGRACSGRIAGVVSDERGECSWRP